MSRTLHHRAGRAATVVVIILMLVLIGGGVWYFVFRSTPERAVGGFLEAARTGDEQLMRKHLTARSGDPSTPTIGLAKHLAGRPEGEPQYVIGKPEISGNRATVPVEFPLGETARLIARKDTFTVPFVLHREGRTWLVDAPDTWEETLKSGVGTLMRHFRRILESGRAPGGAGSRHI